MQSFNIVTQTETSYYQPKGTYFNETIKSNVFICENQFNNTFFMIPIKHHLIDNEITGLPPSLSSSVNSKTKFLSNLNVLKSIDNPHLIKPVALYENIINEIYWILDYCNGLTIINYILYSSPSSITKWLIWKQFSEVVLLWYNKGLNFNELKIDFCFIVNLENPLLKVIYNVNDVIETFDSNGKKNMNNSSSPFKWLGMFIYTLAQKVNSSSIEHDFEGWFNELDNDLNWIVRKMFGNVIRGCKNEDNGYSLKDYVNEINLVLARLGVDCITIEVNNDIINPKSFGQVNMNLMQGTNDARMGDNVIQPLINNKSSFINDHESNIRANIFSNGLNSLKSSNNTIPDNIGGWGKAKKKKKLIKNENEQPILSPYLSNSFNDINYKQYQNSTNLQWTPQNQIPINIPYQQPQPSYVIWSTDQYNQLAFCNHLNLKYKQLQDSFECLNKEILATIDSMSANINKNKIISYSDYLKGLQKRDQKD